MTGKHSLEIEEIIPRDYVDVFQVDTTRYQISRINFILAHVAVTHPKKLEQIAFLHPNYKAWELNEAAAGRLYYNPLFDWSSYQEELIKMADNPKEFIETLVEGIRKKEGTKKIWYKHGQEHIYNKRIRGNEVEATVETRKDKRKKVIEEILFDEFGKEGERIGKRSEPRTVNFKDSFLDSLGRIVNMESYSSSPDFAYGKQKLGRFTSYIIDYGLAMLLNEFYKFHKNPKTKTFKRRGSMSLNNPFFPINVVDDSFLWHLTVDVLVHYYILGEGKFSINKRLAQISDINSRHYNESYNRGEINYAVIKQRTKEEHLEPRVLRARISVRDQIEYQLHKNNFKREGIYLEFKGTSYESPAVRFENAKGDVVGVVLKEGIYYFVYRKNQGKKLGQLDDSFLYPDKHPFSMLSFRRYILKGKVKDDYTKHVTDTMVFFPNAIKIPSAMESFYRKVITKSELSESRKTYLRRVLF